MRTRFVKLASFAAATALWLTSLSHVIPTPTRAEAGPRMLDHTLSVLADDTERTREIASMRGVNPEWDLMWRTYTTLALADLALDDPARRSKALEAMDHLMDDTIEQEKTQGQKHFLLPYANASPWLDPAGRSVFVDGEILLELAARQHVERDPSRDGEMRARQSAIASAMERAPALSAESYPDECWVYSDAVALAGLRASDSVLGTDHRSLAQRWVQVARERFVHGSAQLLISSHTSAGVHRDRVEGSTLWMTIHALLLVDPAFANEQWTRGKTALLRQPLGFAYAREWPTDEENRLDVDSGPVVPLLGAGPASSGLAFVAARGFNDEALLQKLTRSLDLTALPRTRDRSRWYAATGAMGHAVVTYGLGSGSLWARLQQRGAS